MKMLRGLRMLKMSKFSEEINNRRLLDAAVRRQLFLERLKLNGAKQWGETLRLWKMSVIAIVARTGAAKISDLNRKQLGELIRALRASHRAIFGTANTQFERWLAMVGHASRDLSLVIYATIKSEEIEPKTQAQANRWLAVQPKDVPEGAKIAARAARDIIPAFGTTASKVLEHLMVSGSGQLETLVGRAYAEGWTLQGLISALAGAEAPDGSASLLRKLINHTETVSETLIQHESNFVDSAVAGYIFRFYKWISVLDSRTSAICRSRSGKLYPYLAGPLPPAHARCRSTTTPVWFPSAAIGFTWHKWQASQPDDVMRHALLDKPMTLEQFEQIAGFLLEME